VDGRNLECPVARASIAPESFLEDHLVIHSSSGTVEFRSSCKTQPQTHSYALPKAYAFPVMAASSVR
jgi:hypothetical protein